MTQPDTRRHLTHKVAARCEIEIGDPVDDEVQIRVHAASMCHSDYHLTTGATPIALPALGGHEGAGVVTKVGRNVKG
ncbi:MAG: alcohol dehydrogenase catalytic domain-containing protein, partial [Mycobacterium sp.]